MRVPEAGLIKAIASGRAFALIGAGPSCEMGYPSWAELADATYRELVKTSRISNHETYERYLAEKRLPELFRQAEIDAGSRQALVGILKPLLAPRNGDDGHLYKLLTGWPFRGYLTTNYDDEIARHLSRGGHYFATLRNTKEDLSKIRSQTSGVVVKLHSDLDHPHELILTSRDYDRLRTEPEGEYFRGRLKAIFQMFDVCILGHSFCDADLEIVLALARSSASPEHPVYMIACDTEDIEREYLERYNIVVTSYRNSDGGHAQLRRILNLSDRFITSRKQLILHAPPPVDTDEAEAAAALLIFRKLAQFRTETALTSTAYLGPLVIRALHEAENKQLTLGELLAREPLASSHAARESMAKELERVLADLIQSGAVRKSNAAFEVTEDGKEAATQAESERTLVEDQAYGQFLTTLKGHHPRTKDADLRKARCTLKRTLVSVFKKRGLSIANAVMAEQRPAQEYLCDLFRAVSDAAAEFDDHELRLAFVEATHMFIVEPTEHQRRYLAYLSQGYFLYHLIGLDPICSRVRQSLFENTAWICDSSILIPLLAVGSHNHDYAVDLFRRLRSRHADVYATDKLMEEAWEHLRWATTFMKVLGTNPMELLLAVLVKAGYKQNLFLDGYIRLSAEGAVGTFEDYIQLVCQGDPSRETLARALRGFEINLLRVENVSCGHDELSAELAAINEAVRHIRETRGSYRSDSQVEADAEVLLLIRHLRQGEYVLLQRNAVPERAYFLSTSRVLDALPVPEEIVTWTPEALYRYASVLPGEDTDPDLLQECMLNYYYYAGVSFIDQKRYLKFFGPSISEAQLSYSEEKEKYLESVEREHLGSVDEAFRATPDLEKPLFVAQMSRRVAEAAERRAQLAEQRARAAEKRVNQLEAEKAKAWKRKDKRREGQEEARLRNLRDPKKVRKLKRQAKRREKKRKK